MKKILITSISLIITIIFNLANAIDVPKNLKLENYSQNSLEISWDAVQDAQGYYVYYGTKSGTGENGYESLLEELVENPNAKINDLDTNTTYYVSVVAIDGNYEESSYSDEGVFTTGENKDTNNFALNEVNVLSSRKIELTFNNNLDSSDSAKREFKIVNKNDNLDEIDVLESNLLKEQNKLELILERDMITSGEYKITVISLIDSEGNNIESGVDGLNSFITPNVFQEEKTPEEQAESEIEGNELESAKPALINEPVQINEKTQDSQTSLYGKEISQEELNKNTLVAAENTEKLPQTGPEHLILLIIALIIGFISFSIKHKKS